MEISKMRLRGKVNIWRDACITVYEWKIRRRAKSHFNCLAENKWRVQSNALDLSQRTLPKGFFSEKFLEKFFPERFLEKFFRPLPKDLSKRFFQKSSFSFSQKTFPLNNNRQTDLDLENYWEITSEEERESGKNWFCKVQTSMTLLPSDTHWKFEMIHPFYE